MATIATLAVNVLANTNPFSKGMGEARGELSGFRQGIGSTLSSITGFIGPLVALTGASLTLAGAWNSVRSSFSNIDEVAKASDKLGLTTEALGGLRHAAGLTAGVGNKQFDTAMQRMTRRLAEAANGTGEAKGAIEELGLSAVSLSAMGPDQAFLAIADAMQNVDGQGNKLRLAFKLFDSEGAALVNTLNQGSGAIREMMQEADELGLTFNRTDAAKIEQANDSIAKLQGSFTGLANEIAIAVAPSLSELADMLTDGVVWIRETSEWIGSLTSGLADLGIDLKLIVLVLGGVVVAVGAIVIALKTWAIAQSVVLALSGPAGWATLAVGAAVAAGAVGGLAVAYSSMGDEVKEAKRSLEPTIDATNVATESMGDLSKETEEASKRMKELTDRGAAITREMRTPVEVFSDRVNELNELVRAGAITWETYGRAVAKAKGDLESAKFAKNDFERSSGTAAVVRGTTAAFSAVQAAQRAARDAAEKKRRDDRRDAHLSSIARSAGIIAEKPATELKLRTVGL